jgi:hypothetical protein
MARWLAEATVSTHGRSLARGRSLDSGLDRGGDTSKTGRSLSTFKEGAAAAGMKGFQAMKGLRLCCAVVS